MWVKICGTTNLEDALLAVEAGADALGFIFAPSQRRVEVAQAAAMTARVPPGVERVGVLAERDPAELVRIVQAAGLTAVQLHMPHDRELTADLAVRLGEGVRLIQVVPVEVAPRDEAGIAEYVQAPLRAALMDPALWGVLLDTAQGGVSGGTGVAFAWERVARAVREAVCGAEDAGVRPARLLLAGGLHAGNVGEAIATLQPWGVDVCSGVEARPGSKDPERLAAFLAAASARRDVGVM